MSSNSHKYNRNWVIVQDYLKKFRSCNANQKLIRVERGREREREREKRRERERESDDNRDEETDE